MQPEAKIIMFLARVNQRDAIGSALKYLFPVVTAAASLEQLKKKWQRHLRSLTFLLYKATTRTLYTCGIIGIDFGFPIQIQPAMRLCDGTRSHHTIALTQKPIGLLTKYHSTVITPLQYPTMTSLQNPETRMIANPSIKAEGRVQSVGFTEIPNKEY